MATLQLFDTVKLNEAVALGEGSVASAGTTGVIVERLGAGEAYLVELFGDWVEMEESEMAAPSSEASANKYMETIGVVTVQPQQLTRVKAAAETMGARGRLLVALDALPETSVEEVADFAEFLQQKQQRKPIAS